MLQTITHQSTIREIAGRIPAARAVFERHGIDYCCGGLQPLEQAAAEKGLDFQSLCDEIDQAQATANLTGPSRDWYSEPLDSLADHIEAKHHAFMRSQLPRLRELGERVQRAHGAKHGKMLAELRETFEALREEIEMHLMKEEQILFPHIRNIESSLRAGRALPAFHCGTVEAPIQQMEHEHENAGEALSKMRRLTGDYTPPADACPTFISYYEGLQALEADLHEHIHLENNILFPRAIHAEAGNS